jgi:transposase
MYDVMRLSDNEIKARMVELYNLRNLHVGARKRVVALEAENKQLKARVSILESALVEQQKINDDLRLQMEELRTIVFGKKKKKEEKVDIDDGTPPQGTIVTHRGSESYKRTPPKEDEVTSTLPHPIDTCNHCGGNFSEKETVTYFVEDIPLSPRKVVIKHIVEKGYCEECKYWSTKEPLPSAKVILGPNVRRYVTYLSVVCRQSYGQIQQILDNTYDFEISQGEIAKILGLEGERVRPEYERLKAKIRGEPSIHLDETGWNLLGLNSKTYAWTMTGGESSESVFVLGKTRGKGNATELIGDSKAVVVSDDYGAYRNLENPHQLCCAHPNRKLRDLAESSEVTGAIRSHCISTYKTFNKIYEDIETALISNDPKSVYDSLLIRLKSFVVPDPLDPAKLTRIKAQVGARAENYLTCLLHPGVAADNNAAERSLRHLVLKRKISFGSFREKTAETLAILCSVLMSYKQKGMMATYLKGV